MAMLENDFVQSVFFYVIEKTKVLQGRHNNITAIISSKNWARPEFYKSFFF